MPPKPFDIVNIFYTVIDQLCTHSQMSLEELCNYTYTTSDQLKPFLDQLEQYDWINKIYQNKCLYYVIGTRFLHFSVRERLNIELIHQTEPILYKLSHICGQTIEMNILENTYAVCINKVTPDNAIRIASRVGRQSPLYAGASGKVLLAYAPCIIQNRILNLPMKAHTPFTIISPERMRQEIITIKSKGYAESVEELDHGAAAIAMPILNKLNDIVAGISIIGTRFDYLAHRDFWLENLRTTIKNIII